MVTATEKKVFKVSISYTKFCGKMEKWLKFVLIALVCVSMWCQPVIWRAIPVFTCKNRPRSWNHTEIHY